MRAGLGLTLLAGHGGCPQGHSCLVQSAADAAHGLGAQDAMTEIGHIEHHTEAFLDASHVIGGKLTGTVASSTLEHVHLTNQVGQFAGIDLHRA